MASDLHGVIWTRVGGIPEKMGVLALSATEVRFTYTPEYIDSGQPGFALLADPRLWNRETVIYPISERIPVFPRLLSLIPGTNPRNLQRQLFLDMLRKRKGHEPPPGRETEWALLLAGGHGGIGHVDVFRDDLEAERWYATQEARRHQTTPPLSGRSGLWGMLRREVLDEHVAFDPQTVIEALGPTPSVGGMIPKMLVSVNLAAPEEGIYPPDTPGKTNVLLKVEPPEYRGLVDLEALCLTLHREAGFEAPRAVRFDHDGLRMLAVERFDQTGEGILPMESLFSIIAMGNHDFRETADVLLEEIPAILSQLTRVARLDPGTGEELYRRLLMALFTGNGDMHLDNIALLGGLDGCRLSPVYDPAPMRAWPRHDLVSAIPYDATEYKDHGALFVALGHAFGLSRLAVRRCIEEVMMATASYVDRVLALDSVPSAQREGLASIVARERQQLAKATQ